MSIHSIAEAKAHLSELVSRVHAHHERITVTVHGTPSAVLLSPDDLERMEETIAVLSDSALMAQLIEAQGDLRADRMESLDDVREAVAIASLDFIQGPLAANPRRVGKRLVPPLDHRWSARRGTYRIVYRIDEETSLVTVIAIAPRRSQGCE